MKVNMLFAATMSVACVYPMSCLADDSSDLLKKISQIKALSSSFSESIIDEDGLELAQYNGTLKIHTGNKSFRIETAEPQKSTVVCDGKDLYSYDPGVEQVSVFSFSKVAQNSPFWLVVDQSPESVKKFDIKKSGKNSYSVASKDATITYNIGFDEQGLNSIKYTDQNGQTVEYALKDRDFSYQPSVQDFKFVAPDGVTIDDQR